MSRNVLVLGGSRYHNGLFTALKEAGHRVTLVDGDTTNSNANLVKNFIAVDFSRISEVDTLLNGMKFDAVLPVNDHAVLAASKLKCCDTLKRSSINVAQLGTSKFRMRQQWQSSNLPIPRYQYFSSTPNRLEIDFPLVVKPSNSGGGGRGVSIHVDESSLMASMNDALLASKDEFALIEEFIQGVELTVESISFNQKHFIIGVSEKTKVKGIPWVAQTLTYPSQIAHRRYEEILKIINGALNSLGHENGPAHTELLIQEDTEKIYLVETGLRPGGGHIPAPILTTISGLNVPSLYVESLSGNPELLDIEALSAFYPFDRGLFVQYRFFSPTPGQITSISGFNQVRELNFVLDADVLVKVGDKIEDWKSSMQRSGFVVFTGETMDEVDSNGDLIEAMIEIRTEEIVNDICD
jgi:biotin carboxylase